MKASRPIAIACLIASCNTTMAGTTEIIEDWDTTPPIPTALRGWLFGAFDIVQIGGGNPGNYLRTSGLDTFAPQPRTMAGLNNDYVGDKNYADMNVTAIGIDVMINAVDFSAAERPLSVYLINDNNTPGDSSDDFGASFTAPTFVPVPGEGWRTFEFEVPSQSETLPPGWVFRTLGPSTPPFDWQDIITDVDSLRFFYGDPDFFFIFQMWNTGIDNFRLVMESAALDGDCDGDGDVDLADFGNFQLCFTGPGGGPVSPDCTCTDFDNDDDVDLADFGEFQLVFTGPVG
jgi:hypothetical protein